MTRRVSPPSSGCRRISFRPSRKRDEYWERTDIAIVRPSGENDGRLGAKRSLRIVVSSPVARSTARTAACSPMTEVKTIRSPAGEKTGPTSPPGAVVARVSVPVAMSRTQMSSEPARSEA